MADFMGGWALHQVPSRPSSVQHIRSHSLLPKSAQPNTNRVSRAISTSALNTMANGAKPASLTPSPSHISNYNDEDQNMSTIPDPRSRTMSPANADSPPSPSQHPDLNSEVATLSNKLINAINHQTNLDDTLSATRHELEASRERIKKLEQENQDHADQVTRGILIKASVAQAEKAKLLELVEEKEKLREEADAEKKKMELDLEGLTAELFEEANKMVITAREDAKKDHDGVQRKNDQLKAQLADTETLLRSHQEQLAELKQVMEQMTADYEDRTNPTAPSTPGLSKFDPKDERRESAEGTRSAVFSNGEISPSYPTSFTHLLSPVLRFDLTSYDEFTSLLRMSKNLAPGSRTSSGSYGSGLGLGMTLSGHMTPSMSSALAPTNGSSSSLGTMSGSTPTTPTTPASAISTGSTAGLTPLKDTKFYKRALAEDVEPTLRLEIAPGLSWLARRAVLASMCEGTLVVEPVPSSPAHRIHHPACSLCGENRKEPEYKRTHRFRTSESDSAQKYPLCKYCLGRVRSSCDYLGFLRTVKDGHWRAVDAESEKAAWEESVRLRESMFWCRIGGGVIPSTHHHQQHQDSPRATTEEERDMMAKLTEQIDQTGEIQPRDVTPIVEAVKPDVAGNEAFLAKRRASKPIPRDDTAEALWRAAQEDASLPSPVTKVDEPEESAEEKKEEVIQEEKKNRDSTQSLEVDNDKDGKRLSITIPGSSE